MKQNETIDQATEPNEDPSIKGTLTPDQNQALESLLRTPLAAYLIETTYDEDAIRELVLLGFHLNTNGNALVS